MRMTNLHEFTEHHRYYIYRGFSLSALDHKTIQLIYQPMVGAEAAGLYLLLYHGVDEGRVGYSALDTQRRLFLGLGLEMNADGRRSLVAAASRLEAVGLLQTSRLLAGESDDPVYEYELQAPLAPDEFFRNQHFVLYLRDRIGSRAVIELRERFTAPEPDELAQAELRKENLSVPFYELFALSARSADDELEQALAEIAPARQPAPRPVESAGIQYGDIIMRFSRSLSPNRRHVERLRGDEDAMAQLNYVAYKYRLDAQDLARLLDEPGIFGGDGELQLDELQRRASGIYLQDQKRDVSRTRAIARIHAANAPETVSPADDAPEEYAVQAEFQLEVPPALADQCDTAQYNFVMRNSAYTHFLKRFYPGAVPFEMDVLFAELNAHNKMPDPVINVLIHYLSTHKDSSRLTNKFIRTVANNMLFKGVDTFEKAVQYVRDQERVEEKKTQREKDGPAAAARPGGRGGRAGGGARKPAIPIVEKSGTESQLTAEQMEKMLERARKFDQKGGR